VSRTMRASVTDQILDTGANLRVLTIAAVAMVPVAVGTAVHGRGLVQVLLGERWAGTVPFLQILAVRGLARSVSDTTGALLLGIGRPRTETLVAAIELGLVAALFGPLLLGVGPAGPAIAVSAAALAGTAAGLWAVVRLLGIPGAELAGILGWPLLACVPVVVTQLGLVGPPGTPLGLAGAVALSVLLYLGGLAALHRLGWYSPDPTAEWGHDPHCVVLCPGQPDHVWQQNHCGVFYSSDGAANWKKVSHPAQGVQRGVRPHQPVAARPVDRRADRGAGGERRRAVGGDVDHLVRRLALDRIDDVDAHPRRGLQHPAIARLAAAAGVEHGAVEPHPALIGRDHARGTLGQVRVVAEQELRHRAPAPCRASRAPAGPSSAGTPG